MIDEIKTHLDKALSLYTSGEFYKILIEAKEEYFNETGIAFEDDEDFESKMSSFNDWFLLQFISKRFERPFIREYLESFQVGDEIALCLLNINHSLFEYTGKSFSGKHILKDILHDRKVELAKTHPAPPMLKGDLAICRVITYKDESHLLDGMTFIPKEVRPILKKQSKIVRKKDDPQQEYEFLIQLEKLKTKWQRYGHIEPEKIFTFS